jgi:hypothetical protein
VGQGNLQVGDEVKLFPDDFIRIEGMTYHAPCWPPPETVRIPEDDRTFRRVSYSQITDEERAKMTHVCRGAQYEAVTGSDG